MGTPGQSRVTVSRDVTVVKRDKPRVGTTGAGMDHGLSVASDMMRIPRRRQADRSTLHPTVHALDWAIQSVVDRLLLPRTRSTC